MFVGQKIRKVIASSLKSMKLSPNSEERPPRWATQVERNQTFPHLASICHSCFSKTEASNNCGLQRNTHEKSILCAKIWQCFILAPSCGSCRSAITSGARIRSFGLSASGSQCRFAIRVSRKRSICWMRISNEKSIPGCFGEVDFRMGVLE